MLKGSVIGVCRESDTIGCNRFHGYKLYLLDRNKIVIEKKFTFNPSNPQSIKDFYQEVGVLHKSRNLLKEEHDDLVTKSQNK